MCVRRPVDLFAFVFGAAMLGSEARLDEVERKSEIDEFLYSEREREMRRERTGWDDA